MPDCGQRRGSNPTISINSRLTPLSGHSNPLQPSTLSVEGEGLKADRDNQPAPLKIRKSLASSKVNTRFPPVGHTSYAVMYVEDIPLPFQRPSSMLYPEPNPILTGSQEWEGKGTCWLYLNMVWPKNMFLHLGTSIPKQMIAGPVFVFLDQKTKAPWYNYSVHTFHEGFSLETWLQSRSQTGYQSGQIHIYFCLKLRSGLVSVTVCCIHSDIFQATFKLPGSAGTQAQAFCRAGTAEEEAAAESTQFGTKLRTSRGESSKGRLRLCPRPLYTRLAPQGRTNLKRQLEWFLKIF